MQPCRTETGLAPASGYFHVRLQSILMVLVVALFWGFVPTGTIRAATLVGSVRAQAIASLIWQSRFARAIDSCDVLIKEEPLNPVGYCLLGITFHSIGDQYRTDRYADSVTWNLDTAIALASSKATAPAREQDRLFLLGSAYGYRALERSVHGSWWGAYRDGHRSCKLLQKAYNLDTTLTDSFLGVGDYHYWKSAKSKLFSWLPFIGDNRAQGIAEIRRVIASGTVLSLSARKSLLPIYLDQRQYAEVISLADSLMAVGYVDPSCLFHKTTAEIELGRWDDAARSLERLRQAWDTSQFVDHCGNYNIQYLKARILAGRGDVSAAQTCLQQIFAAKNVCFADVYFRQTLSAASATLH
jgi:tetratricopeptide (TPR) repeat protein